MIGDEYESLDRGLPFRQRGFFLWKASNVCRRVAQRAQLFAVGEGDRVVKFAWPSEPTRRQPVAPITNLVPARRFTPAGFSLPRRSSPNMTGGEFAAVVATMPLADQQAIRTMVREIVQERNQ